MKLIRKTRNKEALEKKLKAINKSDAESGYFKEQGFHNADNGDGRTSTEPLTYAELMNLHEYGFEDNNLPARPVRAITLVQLRGSRNERKKLLSNYLYKGTSLDSTLNGMAVRASQIAKSIFGSTSLLAPNSTGWANLKGANSPLVDTGDLKANWAYRNSVSKVIKTGES